MRKRDQLRKTIEGIVGPSGILTGEAVHARSCDPFVPQPTAAHLLARPANTRELSAVVAACARHGQPIVTHGGLTGVSGGAYSRDGDIVISLERMRRIEELDADEQIAVVEGGLPLAKLQEVAAEHGLMYPVDLISQGTATVGGTISTNAGGNRVVRWGMTRRHVLGLEVVLADGTVLPATNRLLKNNTGYDLKQLFIGGEGTLGIVSRAVLQLVALPQTRSVTFVAVASFEALVRLLARSKRLPILSAFEVMWQDYYGVMAASGTDRKPLPEGHPFYVLIETLGYEPDYDAPLVERFQQAILDEDLVVDAVSARSEADCRRLWRVREGAEVLVAALRPFVGFDISVSLRQTAACVEAIRRSLTAKYPAARMVTFGHLGDNNFHLAVTVGPDTAAVARHIEDQIYRELARFQGSISAEHGIGQTKREFLHYCKSPAELRLMRRLKGALDPRGLLNPEVLVSGSRG